MNTLLHKLPYSPLSRDDQVSRHINGKEEVLGTINTTKLTITWNFYRIQNVFID